MFCNNVLNKLNKRIVNGTAMIPLSVLINPTNLSAYLSNFAFASHPALHFD